MGRPAGRPALVAVALLLCAACGSSAATTASAPVTLPNPSATGLPASPTAAAPSDATRACAPAVKGYGGIVVDAVQTNGAAFNDWRRRTEGVTFSADAPAAGDKLTVCVLSGDFGPERTPPVLHASPSPVRDYTAIIVAVLADGTLKPDEFGFRESITATLPQSDGDAIAQMGQ